MRVTTAFVAWLLAGAAVMSAAEIPLKDFFRAPEHHRFQISEDGNWISYLAPHERRLNLFVFQRGGLEVKRVTSDIDRSISYYIWKGSDHLLFLKDFGGDENYHLFCVDKDGREQRDLTPFPDVRVAIEDRLPDNPQEVLIRMNRRNPELFDVYRLNIVTAELHLVAENPGNVTSWLTDHEGRVRVAQTSDGVNRSLLYRETEAEPFRVAHTGNFREQLDPLLFTFDNRHVIALSNIGRDKTAVVKIDPATARELEVISRRNDVDMAGVSYSRARRVLTESHYSTWKTQHHFLDTRTAAMYRRIMARLPGYEIDNFDTHDRAEQTYIFHAYNARTRGAEYLYDRRNAALVKLADRTPWLRERAMAEVKPIVFRSRDGLKIPGYLTLPTGRIARKLPVVVKPHGGPWARDAWVFDPEAQFFASRGYAVLQVNFRGSTGYGRKFWEASFKQWGRKMQDDITDGVRWLIRRGIADPKRIAIYGGSYGGYAALAGVTFTPDLYACGIDYVGVANIFTFLKTIPPYWRPQLEVWQEMVGDPETDKELLKQISPVFHVQRIKVPLLIAQGANDPRVNRNESDQMVAALRERGVPVQYIVKDDEGHGFVNEENRIEFYAAVEEFLSRYLSKNTEADASR